jgi:hypothetical protein
VITNTNGDPVREEYLCSPQDFTREELVEAVLLLCGHLNVSLWRTNATKHGGVELELRKEQA